MQWENIHDYYIAWGIYLVGALGCSWAAWIFFRGLPRALVHFFVITVMVLLFTPYALDAETMIMAPAIMFIGYGVIAEGFASVKPILKTTLIIWTVAIVLSLIYQLLTRHWYKSRLQRESQDYDESFDDTLDESFDETEKGQDVLGFDSERNGFYPPKDTRIKNEALLEGEIPLRAER